MIDFKPLEASDFVLLNTWMNLDFVSRWYEKRKEVYDNVEKKYKHTSQDFVPVDSFLIMLNDVPIGYIQRYFISQYPSYRDALGMDAGYVGVDMFIGDRAYIGKGYGTEAIHRFVKQQVFSLPKVTHCVVGIEPSHSAAKRMYEKAGFKFVTSAALNNSEETEEFYVKRKSDDVVVFTSASVAGDDAI